MNDLKARLRLALGTIAAVALLAGTGVASAQKIVCWKDKTGKVVGCGDKVPPEYQSSATKELDSRGITRRTTESADEATQRRTREQEAARVKAEDDRKQVDLKRHDTALLETYSNEKEIDLKRDRDLQVLDGQLEQLTASLKNVNQRYNDVKGRHDAVEKSGKPAGKALKDELARASADKQRIEQSIESKNKEKQELRERFAGYKKRYAELRGTASSASTPAPAPQSAVAAKK